MAAVCKQLIRLLAGLAGLYLLTAGLIAAEGLREGLPPLAEIPIADAAVVFGNKVERSGEPSASLRARLDKAVDVYQRGLVRRVIVSGGLGKEGWNEAEVMASYLAGRGLPRETILIDAHGNNTYLTAINTRGLAEAHNLRSFILISHFYHLPRAQLTFHSLGLEVAGAAYARRFVPRDFYYGLMREVIAYPVYLVRYSNTRINFSDHP